MSAGLCSLWRTIQEDSSLPLQLLGAPGSPWGFGVLDVQFWSLPSLSHGFLFCALSLSLSFNEDTSSWSRAHPNPAWLIWTNYICKDLISQSSRILRFWEDINLGDTVEPTKGDLGIAGKDFLALREVEFANEEIEKINWMRRLVAWETERKK